ncbi:hypothetical protein VNO78_30965 [Psophocarpus tetragonolobus]|uniref:Glycosyltransferase n=1 Tax=Psophocarpus tetragonolobus TaxID=3891 RepID=A0AAN9RXU5_PSOTE
MALETPIHILLVSYPAQGHVNPMLRLGKHLAAKGCFVTFSTAATIGKLMHAINETSQTSFGEGFLSFDFLDDGLGEACLGRLSVYSPQLERVGKELISQMVTKYAKEKRPVSCIIYDYFLSWVNHAAIEHAIPCAAFWIPSAATFTACHHYFKKLSPFPTHSNPYINLQLPDIVLKYNEIPDFLHPFGLIPFVKTLTIKQFENLSNTFCVLMDTFEELEQTHLNYLSQFYLVRPVGPLFKNPLELTNNNNIRGDFFKSDDCIEWLNSRSHGSVVYISFGTIVPLSVEQIGEFAHGLLESEVSFLWVLKPHEREEAVKGNVMPERFFERTSERGKVVQWCPQEEVLVHPSVTCFLSHCGWNSTMEALACGVPVLTFAQWGDLVTNAKFLVDVYGVGIRVLHNEFKSKVVVTRDDMKRVFVEAMVGEKAKELKKNALKWKSAAEAARVKGGSSDRNLDAFVEDVKKLIIMKSSSQ